MNNPAIKLTPQETASLETLFARVGQLVIEKQGWGKTCLDCHFFNEQTEICGKWNARPPARTIVEACPAFDPVPF
jgi:hypothetical protein